MWPMSTDCPRTFSQGIFLCPKLCSYQVIKLPVAGDYQAIIAVVGRMIGWSERTVRPPDADLQKFLMSGPPRRCTQFRCCLSRRRV